VRFSEHVLDQLRSLHTSSLHRSLLTLDGPTGATVDIGGRTYIQLASNDYLSLAHHPEIVAAVAAGASRWGTGAGASRLITGHQRVHEAAERSLADLIHQDAALLFPTGYMANVGAIQALVGRGDLILSDVLNHASLIDGCRLSGAKVLVYPHRDVAAARALLETHRKDHRAALLVTDAIFSMDATAAPLAELRALTDAHDAGLLVDEAHALGVLGPNGAGLLAELGLRADVVIGTLGKALGLMGAFAGGSPEVVDLLLNRARSFVFATGISPAIAAAVPTAVALVRDGDDRRRALLDATLTLSRGLLDRGYDVRPGRGPILPVWIGEATEALVLSQRLWERGVVARAIRPPTVPPGTARLRVVPTASSSPELVQRALNAFP
jgi:8-amino-7-oxononanoate synthase